MSTKEDLEKQLAAYVGTVQGPVEIAQDAVNEAMIRHWCEAMGDRNPAYLDAEAARRTVHGGIVAPPVMLQAWILGGPRDGRLPARAPRTSSRSCTSCSPKHGYTGVVATNYRAGVHALPAPGRPRRGRHHDRVDLGARRPPASAPATSSRRAPTSATSRTSRSARSRSACSSSSPRSRRSRPPPPAGRRRSRGGCARRARTTTAGGGRRVDRGELLIQKCSECGALRHPPRPMCPSCQSTAWSGIPSKGRGTVYSYVVMRPPADPRLRLPARRSR